MTQREAQETFDPTDVLEAQVWEEDEESSGDRGDSIEPSAEPEKAKEPEAEQPAAEEPAAEAASSEEDEGEDKDSDSVAEDLRNKRIPYERFKKRTEQLNTAQKRITDLEAQIKTQESTAPVPETAAAAENQVQDVAQAAGLDLSQEQLAEMGNKILEGDMEGYAKSMSDMINNVYQRARQDGAQDASNQFDQRSARDAQQGFNEAHQVALMNIPELDPDSESFDAEFENMVAAQTKHLIDSGAESPVDALHAAVDKMGRMYGYSEAEAEAAAPEKAVDTRKRDRVKRNVDTSAKQPPRLESNRSELNDQDQKLNLASMTDDQFDEMSEAQLAVLRGDVV
jgi:hypothetical protein